MRGHGYPVDAPSSSVSVTEDKTVSGHYFGKVPRGRVCYKEVEREWQVRRKPCIYRRSRKYGFRKYDERDALIRKSKWQGKFGILFLACELRG